MRIAMTYETITYLDIGADFVLDLLSCALYTNKSDGRLGFFRFLISITITQSNKIKKHPVTVAIR